MRKTIIRQVFLLFLSLSFACMENEPAKEDPNTLTTDAARKWYEACKSNETSVEFRSGNGNKLTLKPKWDRSSSGQNANYDVIETAITADHVFSFMDEGRKEKYQETQDERYLLSKTTLVIRKNKETGETEGFLLTISPDLSYLESTNFDPFKKNNYLKRDKKFSGHVLYHDMEGRFVNGWRYEDGMVYPIKLIPTEGGASDIELRTGCDMETVYIEVTECTPFVEYTSGELTGIGIECATYGGYAAYPNCGGGSSQTGDGSGDYGGGMSTGNPPNGSSASANVIIKKINLNDKELQTLNEILSEMLQKCGYIFVSEYITGKKFSFSSAKIDPNMDGLGSYNPITGELKFKNGDFIRGDFPEEFIHLYQNSFYPGGTGQYLDTGRPNIEFEAKVMVDVICVLSNTYCYKLGATQNNQDYILIG